MVVTPFWDTTVHKGKKNVIVTVPRQSPLNRHLGTGKPKIQNFQIPVSSWVFLLSQQQMYEKYFILPKQFENFQKKGLKGVRAPKRHTQS